MYQAVLFIHLHRGLEESLDWMASLVNLVLRYSDTTLCPKWHPFSHIEHSIELWSKVVNYRELAAIYNAQKFSWKMVG